MIKSYHKRLITSILIGLAILAAVHYSAMDWSRQKLLLEATETAGIIVASIDAEMERLRYLPQVLSVDQDIITAPDGVESEAINLRLERLSIATEVEAIYVMNRQGLTVAASNWREADTFLNQNYAFRSYFRNALQGKLAREFAVGATTGRPGIFISHPLKASEKIVGVVVVKVNLAAFSNAWKTHAQEVLLLNQDGIVVDAGRKDWRFRSTLVLSDEQRARIEAQKQFANYDLALLDLVEDNDLAIRIEGDDYFRVSLPVEWLDWQLWLLLPQAAVLDKALVTTSIAALVMLIAISGFVFMRSERFRSALRASLQESDELKRLNQDLGREIEERKAAQIELQNAQVELKQSAKLAALGQLAASVTHELGQPLSAMKTYVKSAQREFERGGTLPVETINRLDRLVDRISIIARQLRFFTRRGGEPMQSLDLRSIVEGAAETIAPKLEQSNTRLRLELPESAVSITGGQHRLEQVLVNLIGNGVDSMGDQPHPEVTVSISQQGDRVHLIIRDNGSGISPDIEASLFEPFSTTRASGDGLGLGLAISASIVQEHKGTISAQNLQGAGAEFIVSLPAENNED